MSKLGELRFDLLKRGASAIQLPKLFDMTDAIFSSVGVAAWVENESPAASFQAVFPHDQ
jgi:hypothetical protein